MDGRLTFQNMDQLENWINTGPKVFNLLYSIKRDGCSSNVFHQKCDNQGPTITVLYNQQMSIYGGYASAHWYGGSSTYIPDSKAFLFQLQFSGNPKQNMFAINPSSVNWALVANDNWGPYFGQPELSTFSGTINCSGAYFALNGSMNIGKCYMNSQGIATDEINNGTMNVTDLEVYKVSDGNRKMTEPWRDMPEWNNQLYHDLMEFISNFKPSSECKVSHARILMMGPVGAGKSSFCNTITSIFRGRITQRAFCGSANQSITTAYTPYLVRTQSGSTLNFRICDTRGLEENMGLDVLDCNYLLDGHVPEMYKFNPISPITLETKGFKAKPTLQDKVHCVVFVVDSTTLDVLPEKILQKMKNFMTLMIDKGIPVAILLTKIDKLCRYVAKDISAVFKSSSIEKHVDIAAQRFGLPRANILPVKNYEQEVQLNEGINILALLSLRQILYFAEDYLDNVLDMTLLKHGLEK